MATDNKTMARKGENMLQENMWLLTTKQWQERGRNMLQEKAQVIRGVTGTLSETLNGDILPFQIICKGKTSRSLPSVKFPKGFCLSYNKSHWSNEAETIRLLQEVIKPYAHKFEKELNLPVNAKVLLVWDAFKAQSSEAIKETLADLDIVTVMVPKNMTHLLQPLGLTTNTTYYNHWS